MIPKTLSEDTLSWTVRFSYPQISTYRDVPSPQNQQVLCPGADSPTSKWKAQHIWPLSLLQTTILQRSHRTLQRSPCSTALLSLVLQSKAWLGTAALWLEPQMPHNTVPAAAAEQLPASGTAAGVS